LTSRKHKKAIYPGTFDPVTNGHISLIGRACNLFDEVVVAVAESKDKKTLLSQTERIDLLKTTVDNLKLNEQVDVVGFSGLLADFSVEIKADAIIRGLRAISDFEYEFQMALMNRKLAENVETVFLMPALSWVYLSSSIVKDVALNGGDVSSLVPSEVDQLLKKKLSQQVN